MRLPRKRIQTENILLNWAHLEVIDHLSKSNFSSVVWLYSDWKNEIGIGEEVKKKKNCIFQFRGLAVKKSEEMGHL